MDDKHSQRVEDSQGRQSERALCDGHLFLLSVFSSEDLRLSGNSHLRQLPACRYHTAECDTKLTATQKHTSKIVAIQPLDSAQLIMRHSLWVPCSPAKEAISGISALININLITLFSDVVSAVRTAYEHQGVLWFLSNRNGPFLYASHGQTHLTLIPDELGKSLTGLFVCK